MLQARLTDPHIGACTLGSPTPITGICAIPVLVMGLPAARITDFALGVVPPPPAPHPIAVGSFTVLIQGLPAARLGSACGCGGVVVFGAPTVITGG
jgi:uncharacterized Zn-binding protein involved in type VI secretion